MFHRESREAAPAAFAAVTAEEVPHKAAVRGGVPEVLQDLVLGPLMLAVDGLADAQAVGHPLAVHLRTWWAPETVLLKGMFTDVSTQIEPLEKNPNNISWFRRPSSWSTPHPG